MRKSSFFLGFPQKILPESRGGTALSVSAASAAGASAKAAHGEPGIGSRLGSRRRRAVNVERVGLALGKAGEGVDHGVCSLDGAGGYDLVSACILDNEGIACGKIHGEAEDGPAARVGWLDLTTLENRSAAFLLKNGVLALAENDGRIMLYRADLSTTESRGFYAIDFIAPLGELLERDSALFLEIE